MNLPQGCFLSHLLHFLKKVSRSQKLGTRFLPTILLATTFLGLTAKASADPQNSIVKIFTVHNTPNYINPWSMQGPRRSTGSGALISGNRILTNAHVVRNQTFLQVRKFGSPKKYKAHVISVAHEADLALLGVEDPEFFQGMRPLSFGSLPSTQDEIVVFGFPLGGDNLSTTKGVISRIEHQRYWHSSSRLLAVQIDAAINPGNSGGPAIRKGKIIGVVMQSARSADNIGYIVPVPVIEHFLEDIKDNKLDGFPSLGIIYQPMENDDLRRAYKMKKNQSGVLVSKTVAGFPSDQVLQAGDVLLAVNGNKIANDGTVEFRPRERTDMTYFVQGHQIGEEVRLKILRDGAEQKLDLTLTTPARDGYVVAAEEYDVLPQYYIYGGLVFSPLSKNLLKSFGSKWYNAAPKPLTALLSENYREFPGQEVVVVLGVLATDLNEGYQSLRWNRIKTVNGKDVKNLADLISQVESQSGEFVRFETEEGLQLVIDRAKAAARKDSLLKLYRIPADRHLGLTH